MKLGSLKSKNSLDGELVVVSRDLKSFARAAHVVPSLREAIEKWPQVEANLKKISDELNAGSYPTIEKVMDEKIFHSCLPRTWFFADGSAFLHHVKLVRKARNAPLPETLFTVPLMYQAESGRFLAPTDPIPQFDFAHGNDFEGEVGVIVDHVPAGISAEKALEHIKLFVILNDLTLRGLIPDELATGFGFFQSKPTKVLSPFAITADELGSAWQDGRIHLPLDVQYNGKFFGKANAKEMHFHFGQLIAHAAKTRDLAAGSLVGSGTVANEDPSMGSSCLAEKRMIEQINTGKIETAFMKENDTVEMEMKNEKGESLFGRIFQKVIKV
ncbi:MAG: fumarylacetoacetate hydrolase family protein [Pseudobdellovibrio sp.]